MKHRKDTHTQEWHCVVQSHSRVCVQ